MLVSAACGRGTGHGEVFAYRGVHLTLLAMNLTDKSKAFHVAVYSAVQKIPPGRVCTYGHIAHLILCPQNARLVGYSLKHSSAIIAQLNAEDVTIDHLPWWRVVQSLGNIALRTGDTRQASLLKTEGVTVTGMKVDLAEFGWFPDEIDME